jgi:hypothetical protein
MPENENGEPIHLRKITNAPPAQDVLFDFDPEWRSHWWGMPAFEMKDARPAYKITVNFVSYDDVVAFGKLLDVYVSRNTSSVWWPPDVEDGPNEWEWRG